MKTCIFVLVPPDVADFSQKVDDLMAPFDVELEVEPYQTECWCIHARARSEITDRVLARLGTMPEIEARLSERGLTREEDSRFEELVQKQGRNNWNASDLLSASETEELQALFGLVADPAAGASRVWQREEREQWKENPPVLRPDAHCPDCNGSGVRTTTDNPDSHFESYSFCCDLEVPAYDPELDENNRLSCIKPPQQSCALEEQPEEVTLQNFLSLPARTWRAARAALRIASPHSCRGCLGYATRLRWAKDWKENRQSMLPVSWIDECRLFPYAVVTPDGEWHDLDVSPFGWDEATIERMWQESVATFERLLEENSECYIAACIIHI